MFLSLTKERVTVCETILVLARVTDRDTSKSFWFKNPVKKNNEKEKLFFNMTT